MKDVLREFFAEELEAARAENDAKLMEAKKHAEERAREAERRVEELIREAEESKREAEENANALADKLVTKALRKTVCSAIAAKYRVVELPEPFATKLNAIDSAELMEYCRSADPVRYF